jgi:hypothetical protein
MATAVIANMSENNKHFSNRIIKDSGIYKTG